MGDPVVLDEYGGGVGVMQRGRPQGDVERLKIG